MVETTLVVLFAPPGPRIKAIVESNGLVIATSGYPSSSKSAIANPPMLVLGGIVNSLGAGNDGFAHPVQGAAPAGALKAAPRTTASTTHDGRGPRRLGGIFIRSTRTRRAPD